MKQARQTRTASLIRTAVAVALSVVMVPAVASAQTKKKKGKPAAAATAPATAPAAGGEIELDANPTAPAAGAAGAATPGAAGANGLDNGTPPPAATPAAGNPSGGICELDPSACPKTTVDLKQESHKDVNAEVYAVQQLYVFNKHRVEIEPYFSFTLNDQFVSHPGPGIAINYYLTNVLAIGVNGNLYAGLNEDSDFNFQNRRATHLAVPLTEYSWGANVNATYVPVYGKFAGFGDFIFSYDAYLVGGVGIINTRPIAVIDPDNRTFDFSGKLDFNVGIGFRIFLNRWFAVNLEVRDYIYNEQLEALTINQQDPTNSSTWYDPNGHITNNVQAQIGVSVFLPFSWKYRLPK